MRLIEMGYTLTPPTPLHNHKIEQVRHDFVEIAAILGVSHDRLLYNVVQQVRLACTSEHAPIQNLPQLHTACKRLLLYIDNYCSGS